MVVVVKWRHSANGLLSLNGRKKLNFNIFQWTYYLDMRKELLKQIQNGVF